MNRLRIERQGADIVIYGPMPGAFDVIEATEHGMGIVVWARLTQEEVIRYMDELRAAANIQCATCLLCDEDCPNADTNSAHYCADWEAKP